MTYPRLNHKDVEQAVISARGSESPAPGNTRGPLQSPESHYIFNGSLQAQEVPKVWRDALRFSVPQSSCPKTLSSVVTKTLERGCAVVVWQSEGRRFDSQPWACRSVPERDA